MQNKTHRIMRLFFLVLLIFTKQIIKAQHCGYDGAYILVVHPHYGNDTTLIPNLKITLYDSLNKPIITTQTWDGHQYKPDTATFRQSLKITDPTKLNYVNNTLFWFAKNNYRCYLFCKPASAKIKVEDVDGEKNQGNFKTEIINISAQTFYPLCANYSSWMQSPQSGFVKNYKVLDISLQKK